jgi:hypothetical protein
LAAAQVFPARQHTFAPKHALGSEPVLQSEPERTATIFEIGTTNYIDRPISAGERTDAFEEQGDTGIAKAPGTLIAACGFTFAAVRASKAEHGREAGRWNMNGDDYIGQYTTRDQPGSFASDAALVGCHDDLGSFTRGLDGLALLVHSWTTAISMEREPD